MYCRYCGEITPDQAKFCAMCGKNTEITRNVTKIGSEDSMETLEQSNSITKKEKMPDVAAKRKVYNSEQLISFMDINMNPEYFYKHKAITDHTIKIEKKKSEEIAIAVLGIAVLVTIIAIILITACNIGKNRNSKQIANEFGIESTELINANTEIFEPNTKTTRVNETS